MQFSFVLRVFFVILNETVVDFLFFPVWWYTRGLVRAGEGFGRAIANRQRSLALGLWITNLFRPMYGQEDWQGKMISFFLRLLILFWRAILFFVWLVCMAVLFLLYALLPVVSVYGIIANAYG